MQEFILLYIYDDFCIHHLIVWWFASHRCTSFYSQLSRYVPVLATVSVLRGRSKHLRLACDRGYFTLLESGFWLKILQIWVRFPFITRSPKTRNLPYFNKKKPDSDNVNWPRIYVGRIQGLQTSHTDKRLSTCKTYIVFILFFLVFTNIVGRVTPNFLSARSVFATI